MSHYHFDHMRIFNGMVTSDPEPNGNSTTVAPPPIGGILFRFIDEERGWEPSVAVDLNGVPLHPSEYFSMPDLMEDIVPQAPRQDNDALWDFANECWWFPDRTRPIAAHGEIMMISDQIVRLSFTQESEAGQRVLELINTHFTDAPVRKREDGIYEAFHPETGETVMCQPGGVRSSHAYDHDQLGLYLFHPECPNFLLPHYQIQSPENSIDTNEYPGWWGYKFNMNGFDENAVGIDYSIKVVSRRPDLYDYPELPPGEKARLYAWNLEAGNFMDDQADIYSSANEDYTDEDIDNITEWLEARGITSPYAGASYAESSSQLYGFTFKKTTLEVRKAKFYFFSYDRILQGILGELVLQGRGDLGGVPDLERPS